MAVDPAPVATLAKPVALVVYSPLATLLPPVPWSVGRWLAPGRRRPRQPAEGLAASTECGPVGTARRRVVARRDPPVSAMATASPVALSACPVAAALAPHRAVPCSPHRCASVPAATLVIWRSIAACTVPPASVQSCAAPTDTLLARSASEPSPIVTRNRLHRDSSTRWRRSRPNFHACA